MIGVDGLPFDVTRPATGRHDSDETSKILGHAPVNHERCQTKHVGAGRG